LAFGSEAQPGWGDERFFAVGHGDSHDALSRPLPHFRSRARVSRAVQELSDSGRRSLLDSSRYVERNALRAGLTKRAEAWRWGSLFRWFQRPEPEPKLLTAWPISRSPSWVDRVNQALTDTELQAIRTSAQRGSPFGDANWVESTAKRLNLESSLRPRGRPRVHFDDENENNES
jgi:hypothetical protein